MQNTNKKLFEETPVPQAVQTMMIPTIIGALVTVLYSLADTLFVGMMNDQIQNAAVALAAPALLAFNAVINLFGIGSSSMMSRALGRGDLKTVCASASLGFYGTVVSGALLSALCYIYAAVCSSSWRRYKYSGSNNRIYELGSCMWCDTNNFKCRHGIYGQSRRRILACEYRNYERMYSKYDS